MVDTNLDLDDLLHTYATADQIGALVGRTANWVRDQARDRVVTAALRVGRHQYDRRSILRLLILARLQEMWDHKSGAPFSLLDAAEPFLDELLKNPSAGVVFEFRHSGPIRLTVSIPPIAVLVQPDPQRAEDMSLLLGFAARATVA